VNHSAGATRVSLATQKVRFAVAMTGGISLAVWMGGVAREINLVTQASDLRERGPNEDPVPPPGGPPAGSLALQVRDLYRRLLELVDVTATVDVLSGTSAGGINAAVLGLANARRLDIGPLRDLWLQAGAFGRLLRNPRRDPNPPSLLQGDGQLLAGIHEGLETLIPDPAAAPSEQDARATTVHITTTLLHGQNGRFTDDYGNAIVDSNNRGLFTFSKAQLVAPGVVDKLALAARSSASFPVAFEPSFVPIGEDVDAEHEPEARMRGWHPDMAPYANFNQPTWAVDGGLLANRPIGPLLRSVLARRADREVRRVLLFVVPSTGSPTAPPPARFTRPYKLGEALRLGLDAALEQSIAADLDAIRRHNDQVTALANTRVLLARLAGVHELADRDTWADYRSVQTTAVAVPMVEEITTRMPAVGGWDGLLATGGRASSRVRAALVTAIEQRLTVPPRGLDDVVTLGQPAFDSARAVALDLIRAGYRLARRPEDVEEIATAHKALNRRTLTAADLTRIVMDALSRDAPGSGPTDDWDQALRALADDVLDGTTSGQRATPTFPPRPGGSGPDGEADPPAPLSGPAALEAAWIDLLGALISISGTLNRLADDEPRPEPAASGAVADGADADMPASAAAATRGTPPKDTEGMRRGYADLIVDYLTFLGLRPAPASGELRTRLAQRLVELHAAERVTSPIEAEIEQRVELVQVSAATRTLLDPGRRDPHSKLTGVQLHHFGAFYKGTWRANDWMWGRLDGAGWLVQLLLDPRRIRAIIDPWDEAVGQPSPGHRARWFYDRLCEIVGPPGQEADALDISEESLLKTLEFLDDPDIPIPPSLPEVALWAALPLQRLIAAEELAAVAGQVRDPANGSARSDARRWLGQYDMAVTGRPPADILDPRSIYERLVQAGVPKRKRISTVIGSLDTLLGAKAPDAVRRELGFLRKAEPVIPASLTALQAWAAEGLPATALAGSASPDDDAWVGRVAATLPTCPVPAERLGNEVGTPLFTRTVTHTLAVATAAGTTTKRKPPVSLAPAISTARTATATAYMATRETSGDGRRLVWLGLLAVGVGIASMFVSVPLVGAAGLVTLLVGAILLGVGLWRRAIPVAGLVVALVIVLLAAAPWLPFLHDRLFSWLERTALPFIERHPWTWTALFLFVLVPPVWMLIGEIARRRRGAAPAPQRPGPVAGPAPVQPTPVVAVAEESREVADEGGPYPAAAAANHAGQPQRPGRDA
jgi:patatin-related protein